MTWLDAETIHAVTPLMARPTSVSVGSAMSFMSLSAKTLLNKSMLYNLINNRNFSIKKRLITSLLEAQKEAVAEIERENRK